APSPSAPATAAATTATAATAATPTTAPAATATAANVAAPAATAAASAATTAPNNATRSQWLTRDAAARLAIRNHLPLAECAHFGQQRTAQALYDAVVTRYSSRATAALGRLLLPYLFSELSAFATVEDLVSHLRTSDARYRATVLADFLDRNQPPMFITLYFIVTRLPDSLRSVRDHFLSLDPTSLTVDLLEQHLLAAETSAVAVSAARGTPRPPFFEGCSPSPLAPSYASAATADVIVAEEAQEVASDSSSSVGVRPSRPRSSVSGCFSVGCLGVVIAARMSFARVTVLVRHAGSFTLSTDASPTSTTPSVLSLVTRLSALAGQICLGIAATALGASESGTLPGTAPAEALHTFTLVDPSGGPVVARSSTVLPCLAVLSGSLSRLHLPSFSANLVSTAALQDAMVTTTTRGGQHVSICTCTQTERHLATFTHQPGSSLYTLATEPPQVAASAQVSASGQVSTSPPALACPALPSLRRGAAARRSSLLLVSPEDCSPTCGAQPASVDRAMSATFCRGDTSVFRVWGSRAFVCDTSADKLSARAIPCVFLGFVPDAPSWQFYHPTSRHVLPSQDVTFDESVPFYRLFPYRSAPSPPLPLFFAPSPPPIDPLPPQGPAPSGVSQVDPLFGTAPVEVAVGSGVAGGAASGGAEPGVAELEGAESGGAEPRGAASSEGPAGALPRLSPQQMREAGGTRGTTAAGPGGARTRGAGDGGAGVRGTSTGGAGAAGAGAVDPGVGGAGGTVRPQPYFVPLPQLSSSSLTPPLLCPPHRREPASRPVLPVRTARRVPRSCPPPLPGTHAMALHPSSVPLRVPLPAPPESSLPEVPDPESDRACAASSTVSRLLATAVTGPSFESATASALVAEQCGFATVYRIDYATALVAESTSASRPSVEGECALGTDVLEDRQEDFECLPAAVLRFASMLLAPK
ncbi:unnamed protein product, partial [Closterium sp. NIES-54]